MPDATDALLTIIADPASPYVTPMDRYREYRQVFLGSEAGRRVLKDIMIIGRMARATAVRGDSHETYLREGERNLAIKIFNATHVEPTEPPAHAQSTRPKEG